MLRFVTRLAALVLAIGLAAGAPSAADAAESTAHKLTTLEEIARIFGAASATYAKDEPLKNYESEGFWWSSSTVALRSGDESGPLGRLFFSLQYGADKAALAAEFEDLRVAWAKRMPLEELAGFSKRAIYGERTYNHYKLGYEITERGFAMLMDDRRLVISFSTHKQFPSTKTMMLEIARLAVDRLQAIPRVPPP